MGYISIFTYVCRYLIICIDRHTYIQSKVYLLIRSFIYIYIYIYLYTILVYIVRRNLDKELSRSAFPTLKTERSFPDNILGRAH